MRISPNSYTPSLCFLLFVWTFRLLTGTTKVFGEVPKANDDIELRWLGVRFSHNEVGQTASDSDPVSMLAEHSVTVAMQALQLTFR